MSCSCPECNNDWGGECLYVTINTLREALLALLEAYTTATNPLIGRVARDVKLVREIEAKLNQ